jgi:hypothetical protein
MIESILRLLHVPKRRIVVNVQVRDQHSITISEWRTNPDLVKLASNHLNDSGFRMMMDVLRNENFANYMMNMTGPTLEDRAFMQARGEGYIACLSNLESMASLLLPKEQLEETFEAVETEQDKEKESK